MVGKAVGSAAAAAAIGLGTVYALNDSGPSARPANIPGSGTHGGNQLPGRPGLPETGTSPLQAPTPTSAPPSSTSEPTSTVTASVANAVGGWRAAHRGTLTGLRAAAWL